MSYLHAVGDDLVQDISDPKGKIKIIDLCNNDLCDQEEDDNSTPVPIQITLESKESCALKIDELHPKELMKRALENPESLKGITNVIDVFFDHLVSRRIELSKTTCKMLLNLKSRQQSSVHIRFFDDQTCKEFYLRLKSSLPLPCYRSAFLNVTSSDLSPLQHFLLARIESFGATLRDQTTLYPNLKQALIDALMAHQKGFTQAAPTCFNIIRKIREASPLGNHNGYLEEMRGTLPYQNALREFRTNVNQSRTWAALSHVVFNYEFVNALPGKHWEAARAGNIDSMLFLGDYFMQSEANAINIQQAFMYYRNAAELGSAHAMHQCGYVKFLMQDYDEAYKWFNHAHEQGNLRASLSLAALYFYGLGVAIDLDQTIQLLNAVHHDSSFKCFDDFRKTESHYLLALAYEKFGEAFQTKVTNQMKQVAAFKSPDEMWAMYTHFHGKGQFILANACLESAAAYRDPRAFRKLSLNYLKGQNFYEKNLECAIYNGIRSTLAFPLDDCLRNYVSVSGHFEMSMNLDSVDHESIARVLGESSSMIASIDSNLNNYTELRAKIITPLDEAVANLKTFQTIAAHLHNPYFMINCLIICDLKHNQSGQSIGSNEAHPPYLRSYDLENNRFWSLGTDTIDVSESLMNLLKNKVENNLHTIKDTMPKSLLSVHKSRTSTAQFDFETFLTCYASVKNTVITAFMRNVPYRNYMFMQVHNAIRPDDLSFIDSTELAVEGLTSLSNSSETPEGHNG